MKVDMADEPKLEAPGAGLPGVELFFARSLFVWKSRQATRESSIKRIVVERQIMLNLIQGLAVEHGQRRVLVERLRGMEDSSRYWSVYMALEHLRIVNLACAGTIRQLGQGKVPARQASTAAVKPSPEAGDQVIPDFIASCEQVLASAKEVTELKTPVRYAHPWFGPLNAADWFFMAGFHMRLHRKQIEAILRNADGR
jgi:hypothetical protein